MDSRPNRAARSPYLIKQVKWEWKTGLEPLGSKEKFWYRPPDDPGRDWLFKFPQHNTGQHWAEKIAAEVARVLGIRHARVELAVLQDRRGSVTRSFTGHGVDLWHGNQVLARTAEGYDEEATFRHSGHTLVNIWMALEHVFTPFDGAVLRAKRTIADYLVLDAVIGNTDRHHENWGILRRRVDGHWLGRMAPSFDHASALGRELRDEKRELLLVAGHIQRYAERGRGGVYWSAGDRHAPSPLQLVRLAAAEHGELFRVPLRRLRRLAPAAVQAMVERVPADWMSTSARRFAVELVRYNLGELQELV